MCHARKERVLLIGTDQRITSGPAARTAAFRGRIHGCTRIVSRKVRFFSLHRGRRPYMALGRRTGMSAITESPRGKRTRRAGGSVPQVMTQPRPYHSAAIARFLVAIEGF